MGQMWSDVVEGKGGGKNLVSVESQPPIGGGEKRGIDGRRRKGRKEGRKDNGRNGEGT